MTKIKLCGLTRPCDIEMANKLHPEYIGFIFAPKSRRYVSPEKAALLKRLLTPDIRAVGVFVRESPEHIAGLFHAGIIDLAQLHGGEGEQDIRKLQQLTDCPLIQAFSMDTMQNPEKIQSSPADYVLLDSGSGGTGKTFDWKQLASIQRPYFLAGGLTPGNVEEAINLWNPYAIDVSSGIETNGQKDHRKMAALVHAIRKEEKL